MANEPLNKAKSSTRNTSAWTQATYASVGLGLDQEPKYTWEREVQMQLMKERRSRLDEEDASMDSTEQAEEKVKVYSFLALFQWIRTRALSFASESRHRCLPNVAGIWLVLILFFFNGLAESGMVVTFFYLLFAHGSLDPAQTAVVYLLVHSAAFMLYPVMGFLADTFFGHYKIIFVSVHVGLVVSALFSFVFSFIDPIFDEHYWANVEADWSSGRMFALLFFYSVLWVTFTGLRVNLIPMGVDQLPEASSRQLSSYFHLHYWFYSVGSLVAAIIFPVIYLYSALSYAFLLITLSFTGMFVVLFFFKKWLIIVPNVGNPIKTVYDVLHFAARAARPEYRSAFQVGQPLPSRLELAMNIHGGKFAVETVENVRTFFRILSILMSFIGYFAVFSQLQSTYIMEGLRMALPENWYEDCHSLYSERFANSNRTIDCRALKVPPSLFVAAAYLLPLVIIAPVIDRIIYPCLRGHTPSMLSRIGIGKLCIILSISVAIGLEGYRQNKLIQHLRVEENFLAINAVPFHTASSTTLVVASPVSVLNIIPQFLMIAFAEVLGNVTAVEFIYAQAPGHMKGILLGLLFGTEGVAMGFAALIIGLHDAAPTFSFCSFFGNSNYYPESITARSDAKYRCNNRLYEKNTNACTDSPLCVYVIFLVIAVAFTVIFMVLALRYKFRKRDQDPYLPYWG